MKVVLAIDDSKVVLIQLKKYLNKRLPNCEVMTETDPINGLEMARTHQKKIDLLIVDYNMDEKNGIEVMDDALKFISADKLVLCTVNTQEILIEKVRSRGVRYLPKPLSQEKIDSLIQEHQLKTA